MKYGSGLLLSNLGYVIMIVSGVGAFFGAVIMVLVPHASGLSMELGELGYVAIFGGIPFAAGLGAFILGRKLIAAGGGEHDEL